jgi:hypothetical protein
LNLHWLKIIMIWLRNQIILNNWNWIKINLALARWVKKLLLFLGLQNLNDNLHFALHFELKILSFYFMERLLVELIHNKDGFYCSVCFCGLGGVYVGCGWGRKLVLHWASFLKELRSNSSTSYWFFRCFLML